jgi:N-acetylglucosamine-6-phosphate deacetylase
MSSSATPERSEPSERPTLEGWILTPEGWVRGQLHIAQGRIARVDPAQRPLAPLQNDPPREGSDAAPLIVPGFIDLHVHGGGGADTMEGGEALRTLARTHRRHGTTSLLATTMTAPWPEVQAAVRAVAARGVGVQPDESRVLGLHLEGPFLDPQRLGAQPPCTLALSTEALIEAVLALHAQVPIRVLTLAPEQPGHLLAIPRLVAAGMRVQIGHSGATYEEAAVALEAGASGFTHLFNAMAPFHHRQPGAVGLALARATHAECIPDLLHVHPGALLAARRAIPGLYTVTDATAAAGMPDGAYRLGRQTVHRCLGAVRLADGTLAGSCLTMDQALRNWVQLGLSLQEACLRVSTLAAQYLGETDLGMLRPGAHADCVVLEPTSLTVQRVMVAGVWSSPQQP